MKILLEEIASCQVCKAFLDHSPRPVLSAHPKNKIVIIGQAPGIKVHESGVPWEDKSGDNLREWMGIEKDQFYTSELIGIVPMGFCYPGRGRSGDLSPRPECAPLWHKKVLEHLDAVELFLLIGSYAQNYYLPDRSEKTLTETVKNFRAFLPKYFVLPHPSPRNNIWQAKNLWFRQEVLPELKTKVNAILN